MKKSYTPFGLYFSNLRKERTQSITEAAKSLNVSIAYISAVEHGDREIPFEWIKKIAKIYNLDNEETIKLEKSFYDTPSSRKISLSEIELSMESMINTLCEGELREKALIELKRRLEDFRK